MSELKCCKLCGAFYTCDHKGECCPECEHFDPVDILCMAGHLKKRIKKSADTAKGDGVDPETFLFEDDDDEEIDEESLPPEREILDEDDDEDLDEDFDDDEWEDWED